MTVTRRINYQLVPAPRPANRLLPKLPDTISNRWFSDSKLHDVETKVKSAKVVIFMKGNPEQPRCGFSNAVCKILEMHGVLASNEKDLFNSFDVLEDDDLRNDAKIYSDWPTFPQVYINGEFVGGCDIMMEIHKNGSLVETLEKASIKSALA